MHRCIELAKLGAGYVAPNPMVGAVLVYDKKIIGEGWHQKFGEAHAEVNCINSVKEEDKQFISRSTLYVSLEPCDHFGKTPPCTDLIIKNKIQKVVVGCLDPSVEVNGKGIEKLRSSGVEVQTGVLEKESKELNKRFFTFHTLHRPYIILKWAQTADGFMAPSGSPNGGEEKLNETVEGEFYYSADPALYGIVKTFASELRKSPTSSEKILWEQLRDKKLAQYKFRRQHIIGQYIADFACLAKKLIIEIDGLIHQLPKNKDSDEVRTLWLKSKGYTVLRFPNDRVIYDTSNVLFEIKDVLDNIPFAEKKIFKKAIPPLGESKGARLLISNEYTNRLVHRWRSEEASILVGTNTALMDDPELTNRHWNGPSPIRLVVDMDLSLPKNLKLFSGQQPTIIFNTVKHDLNEKNFSPSPLETTVGWEQSSGVGLYQVTSDVSLVHQIINALYQLKIQSVLVEGGARLLQSFIDEGMWDEARIISNRQLKIGNGLTAPEIENAEKVNEQDVESDKIEFYLNRSLTNNSLLPEVYL